MAYEARTGASANAGEDKDGGQIAMDQAILAEVANMAEGERRILRAKHRPHDMAVMKDRRTGRLGTPCRCGQVYPCEWIQAVEAAEHNAAT